MRGVGHYIFIILMVSALCISAQHAGNAYYRIKQLKAVDKRDTLKEGLSVIYGSFVHRSRLSDVYERYDEIRLEDTVTGSKFAFSMSPDKYAGKYYLMAFHINPGVYFLTEYYYAERRLVPRSDKSSYEAAYYGQFRQAKLEPIYKSIPVPKDTIPGTKFILVVKENSVNFIGNWNFNDLDPPFRNKKDILDEIMEINYPRLDLKKANIALPY